MKHYLFTVALTLCADLLWGQSTTYEVRGRVLEALTGEPLVGATIHVKGETTNGTTAGLDGSFILKTKDASPVICCSFIGFQSMEIPYSGDVLDIRMKEEATSISDVIIVSNYNGSSDVKAIEIEKKSINVVNVMSSKSMELAPDITVGNIIQRMSGVTVERNSSGEGQYAILRGMDKRYNYTLVNGVKIPSPDNKNRFVPLDLFPSEILSRIEVNKSMTADLEGDGIGGAVNLVMKDAPVRRLLTFNLSTGYNATYLKRDFLSSNHGAIVSKSPDERMGNIGQNKVGNYCCPLNMKSQFEPIVVQ